MRIGAQWYEVRLDQMEKILPDPVIVPVPRAPEQVLGLLLYDGQLIPVFLPEEGADRSGTGRFAVLVRIAGGALRAVLADEIAGDTDREGDGFGTVHG